MKEFGLVPANKKIADCPLQSVDVLAKIDDTLSEVTLTQTYVNNGVEPIEATYKFPLPYEAKVTGFKARFGEVNVTGEFREHDQAVIDYDQMVSKGHSALLVEQHRQDIFEVSLGNIGPGEIVSITFSYIQDMIVTDDEIRWTLPTVIAPRYSPVDGGPTSEKDQEAVKLTHGHAPYQLSFLVEWSSPQGLKSIHSPTHTLKTETVESTWKVSLADGSVNLDRDLILIASLSAETPNSVIVSEQPEQKLARVKFRIESTEEHIQQKANYIFLIDVSGSMHGTKIDQAKKALQLALRNMESGDSFNIVAFESRFHPYNETSVLYSQDELEHASKWVDKLTPTGGTEIYAPLEYVLKQKQSNEELEKIVMLFTDGEVSNESQILRLIEKHNQNMRLYSFGIDTAVNRVFIDGIAKVGNGVSEYVYPGERVEDKVIRQFSRIHAQFILNPKVKDVNGRELNFIGAAPERLYCDEQYDIILEADEVTNLSNLNIHGTFKSESNWLFALPAPTTGDARLMALHWAKQKINDYEKQLEEREVSVKVSKALQRMVVNLSQTYGIMSNYTALIAIHERQQPFADRPETIVVPVSLPYQWAPDYGNLGFADSFIDYNISKQRPDYTLGLFSSFDTMSETRSLFCTPTESYKSTSRATLEDNLSELNDPTILRDEMLIHIAAEQNADGSFGDKKNHTSQTAWFIIGFLQFNERVWRMYRKQLEKAGKWLLQSAQTSNKQELLLVSVATQQLLQQGVLKSKLDQEQFVQLSKSLDSDQFLILDMVKNKQYDKLLEYCLVSRNWNDPDISFVILAQIKV